MRISRKYSVVRVLFPPSSLASDHSPYPCHGQFLEEKEGAIIGPTSIFMNKKPAIKRLPISVPSPWGNSNNFPPAGIMMPDAVVSTVQAPSLPRLVFLSR